MLKVRLVKDRVLVGERLSISFQRTLRIPDDGNTYPLPPGLGQLPAHAVAEYRETTPPAWADDAFFIPMYQREALWLGFDGASWKPNALKVGVGGIDAISGEKWQPGLSATPQNYIVCPDQPWLDGINAGSGFIRQFVAMPLGAGYTVEGQLTGEERIGGIQLVVFEPKPGRFPDAPPPGDDDRHRVMSFPASSMGLAAGGRIEQAIFKDTYGIETWDPLNSASITVHIANSEDYQAITGRPAPPTPVNARTYTEYGLPWFELYDEKRTDIAPSERLGGVKSTGEIDEARTGRKSSDDEAIDIDERRIWKLKGKPPFTR